MALAAQLEQEGMTANRIQTSATVTLEKLEGGFSITAIHLDLVANIPGASQEALERVANIAKLGCPVSKVLNATITLSTKLESY
jgi:osmotically inducible protein OsmC